MANFDPCSPECHGWRGEVEAVLVPGFDGVSCQTLRQSFYSSPECAVSPRSSAKCTYMHACTVKIHVHACVHL